MVERVTNQALQNTALANIFTVSDQLQKVTTQLASGLRINTPSDDPTGTQEVLNLRTSISQTQQYSRNIDFNTLVMNRGDSVLNTVAQTLTNARTLAVGQLNGTATAQTRQYTATSIDSSLQQVLQAANTTVNGQYIFAGTKTQTSPFSVNGSEAVYKGNTQSLQIQVDSNVTPNLSVPGSSVMGTHLNPALTAATPLANFSGGAGIAPGAFVITNRNGQSATINVTAGMTAGGLIGAINAAGINVTASINGQNNGLLLTDASGVVTQPFTISETAGGHTAQSLGIVGSRTGAAFAGTDVNPSVNANTALAQLNGGNGLTLGAVHIVNGSASGTITLSSAKTIGDVINLLNGSGFNITASINSAGNALRIVSNNSATVAVANNIGTDTTAQDLGIGGGRNVLTGLIALRDALNKNDQAGIIASLANLQDGAASINNARSSLGAVLNMMTTVKTQQSAEVVDFTQQMGTIQDTNLAQAASQLTQLQTALQASNNVTARIVQPTLLDFLK